MSLSSHFNETLHALRQKFALPDNMAVADDMPRVRGTLVEHRLARERTPHPYADLPPAQRQFRVARMDRAIEVAIRRGRHDLAKELRRLKGCRG